jgi:hypothetical protein
LYSFTLFAIALLQTKVLVMDLVHAGNASCDGPEWSAFKDTIASLDLGAPRVLDRCSVSIKGMIQLGSPCFL